MFVRRILLKGLVGAIGAALPGAALMRTASADADKTRIKVGVRGGVDEEIFEVVTKIAAKAGLTIEAVVITGTVSPNEALNNGDLDANAFQHIPFLNSQIKARSYRIVPVANTLVSPIAIYSRRYKNLADLPDGAGIGIPDDVANQTRALVLLNQLKLITLRAGADPFKDAITLADVAGNPRHFRLIELTSIVLARTLADLDAAIIVNTFAYQVGLLATRDGLAVEAKENNPYVNVIAVREQDRNAPWVPRLVAAYQSQEVRDFIAKRYEGAVYPAF